MKILYYLGWSVTRIVSTVIFRIRVRGKEHFPKSGGFILATNHVSNYDPLLAGSWAPRQVYFFAKQELFKNRFFGWVIRQTNALPVKRGAVDRQALQTSLDVIARGYGLTIFPEGTRSKTDSFLDPKPGVGLLAVKAGCMIVPGYLHGSNKLKDCFWGRDRMAVTYGDPMTAEMVKSFESKDDGYQQIATEVMNRIGALKAATLAANNQR